jgi:hypothetical protein
MQIAGMKDMVNDEENIDMLFRPQGKSAIKKILVP